MSIYLEIITSIGTGLPTVLIAFFGYKGKVRFDKINENLNSLKINNDKEHSKLNVSISYLNARNDLKRALIKVCGQSIAYTEGEDELNSFKTGFTNSIIKLGESTLATGFKKGQITKDIFRGYMDVGGKEIRSSYPMFNDAFIDTLNHFVYSASEIYFQNIIDLINDDVFNDKNDRFVDITITFLRDELMIVTKKWWTYKKDINYKII